MGNSISPDMNIFLIGFMGCGKSAAASFLHRQYHMPIIEMDEEIVSREGKTIPTIFKEDGEPYFRKLETELLMEISESHGNVVSCGGGVAMKPENIEIMKKRGKVVLLTASPQTILERVSGNNNRPLLEGKKNVDDIQALLEARRPFYENAADIVIQTDKKRIPDIGKEIYNKVCMK